MKQKNRLILEFTEFNLQRLNPDSARASVHVDDPKLSIDAFDKHQDKIRAAMSRINDILYNLKGTSAYSKLRSKIALEEQDIKNLKVLRIIKSNNINYDVYISFIISDTEYFGVVKNIMNSPELKSEVFKDHELYQAKEWVVKIKGLIIKTIKQWLKPEPGIYKLINDEVVCYSVETGKMHKITKGIEIELVRSHSDKLIIKIGEDYCNLVGDNYIYFNWWFEKIN
jgi:hypothetical protein